RPAHVHTQAQAQYARSDRSRRGHRSPPVDSRSAKFSIQSPHNLWIAPPPAVTLIKDFVRALPLQENPLARFTGLLGLIVFIGVAYLFSTNRRAIRWRTVAWGLGLQFLFAFIVLDSSLGQRFLAAAGSAVNKLLENSVAGSEMVFGPLGGNNSAVAVFAFRVLPTIIFISAFFAILYYIGVMQLVIRCFAWIMQKTMGISGAESTNVAASIFM